MLKTKSDELNSAGFNAEADNADSSHTTTQIYYNGDSRNAALGVAETLGVEESNVLENSQGLHSTEYDVVVVLGSDQA